MKGKVEKFKFNDNTTLLNAVKELEEISYDEENDEWTNTSGNCSFIEGNESWDWGDYSYYWEMETFDVVFGDEYTDDCHGWEESIEYCKQYIETTNGTDESYFEDYKGGTVSIVSNLTGDIKYNEIVKQAYR
jgi:hypothetical protein